MLVSLSIRHVGPVAARALTSHFGSLAAIFAATQEQLAEVEGVGPTLAASILEWIGKKENQQIISQWQEAGVLLEIPGHQGPGSMVKDGVLSGLTVVITGSMETMTREQAEELVLEHGGKPASSVSKKTSFLVAGPGAGSKLAKAESLGVEVISESDFLGRLGLSPN